MQSEIREPAVAGLFYPAEPDALSGEVESLLTTAAVQSFKGDAIALILPHAGYSYSGTTASQGYKLLAKERFDSIVIVAPSHREYFDGISIFDGAGFRTPLGVLPVNRPLANSFPENTMMFRSDIGHRKEHAIEVHLPFLQLLFGSIQILPIVMGDQRRTLCFYLGDRLAEALKEKKTLLIASTDLSHYHPYEDALRIDAMTMDDILNFDDERMMTDLEDERIEMCGGGPTVAVLRAAKLLGATKTKILHHCNSGDVTGEHNSVVGYVSAVAFKPH